jgi:hypothetical protein
MLCLPWPAKSHAENVIRSNVSPFTTSMIKSTGIFCRTSAVGSAGSQPIGFAAAAAAMRPRTMR